MSIIKQIIISRTPKPRFPVLEGIKKRFSPRVFSPEPVPEKAMQCLFEAARLAPSARNHQPWFFYWMRKETRSYNDLLSCLPERNMWAQTAPVLILACYDPTEPRDVTNKWALYDLGQAVISLILQVQELGYYCRQIGIFDLEKAKEVLRVMEPYNPFIVVALGKLGKEEDYRKADPEIVKKDIQASGRKEKIEEELK